MGDLSKYDPIIEREWEEAQAEYYKAIDDLAAEIYDKLPRHPDAIGDEIADLKKALYTVKAQQEAK